jgi:glycosyltransferase involved in cell wall biosynthesis
MDKTCIFIPAYNAETTLGSVISRIPHPVWNWISSLWIINDGSTDGTAGIIEHLKQVHPAIQSVTFTKNCGYGAAAKEGLRQAKSSGASFAVCLHADGQYAPEKLTDMVEAAQRQNLDLVQGSRHASGTARQGGMPLYKVLAGLALTKMENRVLGLSLTDYHSGYLCYSRRALTQIPFETLANDFVFDLEIIVSAKKRNLHIGEIPIPTRYAGEVSHLKPLGYGLRVLRVMLRYLLGRY